VNLTFLSATSAFVGLATMVVLFPVPGYIAKKVRDVQVQRMKMVQSYLKCLSFFLSDFLFIKFKVDARVQDVTEGILHTTMIFHSNADVRAFFVYSCQCPTNDQAFRVGT
jgi:hypothetical protein